MPVGRQLPVILAHRDEADFLTFLRSTSPIRIIRSFAPNAEELWIESFKEDEWAYHIWNSRFPWKPEVAHVGPQAHNVERVGWAYFRNTSAAPLLEYSRGNMEGGAPGRLYWAKDFAAPEGLAYDSEEFGRWIDEVWKWVRKVARRVTLTSGAATYLFPNAAETSHG